jgi:hypothetical protein
MAIDGNRIHLVRLKYLASPVEMWGFYTSPERMVPYDLRLENHPN